MADSQTAILAIRPEPGLSATLAAGRKMGLAMHGFALARVTKVEWELPSLQRFDGLLIGSANAIRLGGANLKKLKHLPVYAVGEATAREAEAAGFEVALRGTGGLQKVLDQLPGPSRLMRLVGSEFVDLTPPQDVEIERFQVYSITSRSFLDHHSELLDKDLIVLLHSGAIARQFASECNRLELDRKAISLAAMGERIVEPAGEGWAAIHISPAPNDRDLLEMVAKLCL